jgi:hypothetical protein
MLIDARVVSPDGVCAASGVPVWFDALGALGPFGFFYCLRRWPFLVLLGLFCLTVALAFPCFAFGLFALPLCCLPAALAFP